MGWRFWYFDPTGSTRDAGCLTKARRLLLIDGHADRHHFFPSLFFFSFFFLFLWAAQFLEVTTTRKARQPARDRRGACLLINATTNILLPDSSYRGHDKRGKCGQPAAVALLGARMLLLLLLLAVVTLRSSPRHGPKERKNWNERRIRRTTILLTDKADTVEKRRYILVFVFSLWKGHSSHKMMMFGELIFTAPKLKEIVKEMFSPFVSVLFLSYGK